MTEECTQPWTQNWLVNIAAMNKRLPTHCTDTVSLTVTKHISVTEYWNAHTHICTLVFTKDKHIENKAKWEFIPSLPPLNLQLSLCFGWCQLLSLTHNRMQPVYALSKVLPLTPWWTIICGSKVLFSQHSAHSKFCPTSHTAASLLKITPGPQYPRCLCWPS